MPSITSWTRLEPFTRLDDSTTACRRASHDPLWLLTRQWQTGEFHGEDAGTPVQARAPARAAPLARFHPGPSDGRAAREPYRARDPARGARRARGRAGRPDPRRDLRLAAEAGLHSCALLDRAASARRRELSRRARLRARGAAGRADATRTGGPALPRRDRRPRARRLRLYPAPRRSRRPAQGRCRRSRPCPTRSAPGARRPRRAFVAWFEARSRRRRPRRCAARDPWVAERLEYSFAVSAAAGDGELAAGRARVSGRALDWYSVRRAARAPLGVQAADPRPETSPAPSCPRPSATRAWRPTGGGSSRTAQVNFGRVDGDPDELLRLLLRRLRARCTRTTGTCPRRLDSRARVYRLQLARRHRRVRGAHARPALRRGRPGPARLADVRAEPVFSVGRPREGPATDEPLFLPPVLAGSLTATRSRRCSSCATSSRTSSGPSSSSFPAGRAARSTATRSTRAAAASAAAARGAAGRRACATARLDRARLLGPVPAGPGRPGARRRPPPARRGAHPRERRARLLAPARPHPRARPHRPEPVRGGGAARGIRLVRQWQHARWVDGTTFLWLARRKSVGRGEGSSGLAFDTVKDD